MYSNISWEIYKPFIFVGIILSYRCFWKGTRYDIVAIIDVLIELIIIKTSTVAIVFKGVYFKLLIKGLHGVHFSPHGALLWGLFWTSRINMVSSHSCELSPWSNLSQLFPKLVYNFIWTQHSSPRSWVLINSYPGKIITII